LVAFDTNLDVVIHHALDGDDDLHGEWLLLVG
jgi:hypothetical protein